MLFALIFIGYSMYGYVQTMKSKTATKETFEVAADMKKLVDHLDVLSKDFSDTVKKLKDITKDAEVAAVDAASEAKEEDKPPKKDAFANKKGGAKKLKADAEDADANAKADSKAGDNEDEEEEGKDNVEHFVGGANRKQRTRRTTRETFVGGVASASTGNYMLL